jgi:acetyl-CoA carboxylase biotin carboxylase subunit
VRFDTLLFEGCRIAPYYDSLIGKLIAWGPDRSEAIERLKAALAELRVQGIHTTAPLHQALATDADIVRGDFHTSWLEAWMPRGMPTPARE